MSEDEFQHTQEHETGPDTAQREAEAPGEEVAPVEGDAGTPVPSPENEPQIVRSWTGWIATENREAYRRYLEETGLRDYRATPGNLDAVALFRDLGDGRTEVVTMSLWDHFSDITAFAGDDPAQAVFYPDDDRFLIDRETTVRHYEVAG